MDTAHRFLAVGIPAALIGSTSGYAVTYLTVEQAQTAMWPGATLTPEKIQLTAEQRRAIEKAARVRVRQTDLRAWRVEGGGWFLVDDVIGKHEFITYAVAITGEGTVHSVEILDYRETYGGQIRNAEWRQQFEGKTLTDPLKLDRDIRNITGATLSCRNVTDGVKRLLVTYSLVLQALP